MLSICNQHRAHAFHEWSIACGYFPHMIFTSGFAFYMQLWASSFFPNVTLSSRLWCDRPPAVVFIWSAACVCFSYVIFISQLLFVCDRQFALAFRMWFSANSCFLHVIDNLRLLSICGHQLIFHMRSWASSCFPLILHFDRWRQIAVCFLQAIASSRFAFHMWSTACGNFFMLSSARGYFSYVMVLSVAFHMWSAARCCFPYVTVSSRYAFHM